MNDDNPILYYAPRTRASGVLTLLEELDVPYELRVLNFQLGEQRKPEYLAVNPLGKVPAIVHNGALVTELGAIFIYLADAFPQKGLAPAIGDALRGPYLRWLVFYGSAFEPAIVDRSMNREPAPASRSPYGDFDGVMALINAQLAQGPYLFGERFTAADILVGSCLAVDSRFWPCSRKRAHLRICRARDVASMLCARRADRRRAAQDS